MPASPVRAEADLNRLYLIVGGAIVIVLFAALIVPWFVNWDSYKANFEQEATERAKPIYRVQIANRDAW